MLAAFGKSMRREPLTERKRTTAQEKSYVERDRADRLERGSERHVQAEVIPAEWHRIEREMPVRPRRTKITAAFDADMVKWFRNLGHGYQARMNAVLRSFMLTVISKEIESQATATGRARRSGVAAKKAT